MTSYNPFGFSKVASDHDLSRQADSPETCRLIDNFCQRIRAPCRIEEASVAVERDFRPAHLSFLLLSYYTAWL
jgi:hypothetical protein